MLSDIPSDSVKNFSDQVVNDPSSLLFGSLADFYRENGLYQEAINICLNGLESHPENIEGRLVLAQCYKGLNEIEKARIELTRILSVRPENSLAKKILSELDKGGAQELKTAKEDVLQKQEPPVSQAVPESVEEPVKSPEPEPASVQAKEESQPLPDAQSFHKGAQAMMVLAAETAEKAKSEPEQKAAEPLPEEIPPLKETPTAKPASKPDDPNAVSAYGKILNDIIQTPQVFAGLLVDESGYPIASAVSEQRPGMNEETSGALSTLVFTTATQAIGKINLGELERVVIDTKNEKIFLNRVGSQVLMVSAESTAKTGLVAVNIKRAIDRIKNLAAGN
jgi:predicted regulator of Ras-like GTPase activity (Roadblock/LC7/MglB family)